MLLKRLWLVAALASSLMAAAPARATYANDGYDYNYATGQWTGWYRSYVGGNTWNEWVYNNGWSYYWTRDFSTNWTYTYREGIYIGYYSHAPQNKYVWFNGGWITASQYLGMWQAQLQAAVQAQQQRSGGTTVTIGGPDGVDYSQNFGANFGAFLDFAATCPTCPRLNPADWLYR